MSRTRPSATEDVATVEPVVEPLVEPVTTPERVLTVKNLRDICVVFGPYRMSPNGTENDTVVIETGAQIDALLQSPVLANYIRLGWVEVTQ